MGNWKIKDMARGGVGIESHDTARAANRALLVLSAHEIKNGREPNYVIEPHVDLDPNWGSFNLPDWVTTALERA